MPMIGSFVLLVLVDTPIFRSISTLLPKALAGRVLTAETVAKRFHRQSGR
ncbi:MAG: hypothetical protein ACLU6Y_14210 [Ruminococcus sp.]